MEPATLTAAALATLAIAKAFEKTGEKVGEKVNDRIDSYRSSLAAIICRQNPQSRCRKKSKFRYSRFVKND